MLPKPAPAPFLSACPAPVRSQAAGASTSIKDIRKNKALHAAAEAGQAGAIAALVEGGASVDARGAKVRRGWLAAGRMLIFGMIHVHVCLCLSGHAVMPHWCVALPRCRAAELPCCPLLPRAAPR